MTKFRDIYQREVNTRGKRAQMVKTMGACAKLTVALDQYFNQSKGSVEDVAKGVAELEILISQVRVVIGYDVVKVAKEAKMQELQDSLDGCVKNLI